MTEEGKQQREGERNREVRVNKIDKQKLVGYAGIPFRVHLHSIYMY